jgi:hypothetical protein
MSAELRGTPYRGHRCRCVISDDTQSDRCAATVKVPDAPVCAPCEVRHLGPAGDPLRAAGLTVALVPITINQEVAQ